MCSHSKFTRTFQRILLCSSVLPLTYTEWKNQPKPNSDHICLYRVPNTCNRLLATLRRKKTFLSRWFRSSYSVCLSISWVSWCILSSSVSQQCPAVPTQGLLYRASARSPTATLCGCNQSLGNEYSMPRVVLVWQGEEAPRDLSLLRASVEQTSWDACQPQTDQKAPHKR